MLGILFLALLLVPVLELYVIVQVAEAVGALETIVLLLAVSAAGAWLLKQQGTAMWRRLHDTVRRGEMPAAELADGAMIVVGGALLLTPGFVTDAVGLTLLLPPGRAALKGVTRRALGRWVRRRRARRGVAVYEADVVERSDRPPTYPHDRASRPPGGDGSPDRP